MSESTFQNNIDPDEINFNELVLKIAGLIRYFFKNWIFLLVLGLIGGVAGFFNAKNTEPIYTADLTFLVEEGKSSSGGGYAGLASQLGLDMGGGGSSGLYQGANFQEFLKSRLMIQKVMLIPYPKDSSKSLADVYFQKSGLKEVWDNTPRTKNVNFPPGTKEFSPMQDSAFGILHSSLISEDFLSFLSVKKSGILKISCTSTDEYFAWLFVTTLVREASNFYVQTKTVRSQKQVDNLQQKSDSLMNILNIKSYNAAAAQDMNPNPARKVATVRSEMTAMEKQVAQTMYTEVYRNLEIAKSNLAQDMPIIQIIDKPVLPLTIQIKSKKKTAVFWGVGFGILGLILLSFKKFFATHIVNLIKSA